MSHAELGKLGPSIETVHKCSAVKDNDGFTLIELLIVLAIVGILALIAYPLYTSYVREAQRSDAKAALLETAQQMERSYTANNEYPTLSDQTSNEGYWTIHVSFPSGDHQSYELTAHKAAGKGISDPTCDGKMTLNERGQNENYGQENPDGCWK